MGVKGSLDLAWSPRHMVMDMLPDPAAPCPMPHPQVLGRRSPAGRGQRAAQYD